MITIAPLQVKLLSLPSQSWGTHKLPYPPPSLPPPWMPGLELRTGPRWLYGAPGVITISLGFLFLCCVVLIAPAVVLVCQIGGELWNLMLNNHNYGICRQGQYRVDKGGGGGRGKEVKTREMAGDQLYDQWLKKHNYCPFLQQICLYHPNTDTII